MNKHQEWIEQNQPIQDAKLRLLVARCNASGCVDVKDVSTAPARVVGKFKKSRVSRILLAVERLTGTRMERTDERSRR